MEIMEKRNSHVTLPKWSREGVAFMNILVVNDDVAMIECLRRGLKMKGFGVIEAINAEEAFQHLEDKDKHIDLVLTDYTMLGMNGIDLLKVIRIHYANLPVILMTAYDNKKKEVDSLCNPCNGFLLKPFTLDKLLQEMEKVLSYRTPNADSSLGIHI
jgi:two-component system response regulator FlrC